MNDQLFTVSEAAEAAGVSRTTLLNYEARGIVSPRRVGNQRAFSAEDIVAVRMHRQRVLPRKTPE